MRFRALAKLAFIDVGTAADVVKAAVDEGLLADLEIDAERFTARRTKTDKWDATDRTSAERSARYRAARQGDHEQEPGA